MKKLISALLVALMLLSVTLAVAEGIDFASMTDDELLAVIDGARNEQAKRILTAAADTVIVDQDGVTIYLTGNNRIDEYGPELFIEAVVVNDTDKNIDVYVDSASVNGWNVEAYGITETSAGKKQKGEFSAYLDDAEVSTIEEIEEIELELYIADADEIERISENIPVTLNFKAE